MKSIYVRVSDSIYNFLSMRDSNLTRSVNDCLTELVQITSAANRDLQNVFTKTEITLLAGLDLSGLLGHFDRDGILAVISLSAQCSAAEWRIIEEKIKNLTLMQVYSLVNLIKEIKEITEKAEEEEDPDNDR